MTRLVGIIIAGPRYWLRLWVRRELLRIRQEAIDRGAPGLAVMYGTAAIELGKELIAWRRP